MKKILPVAAAIAMFASGSSALATTTYNATQMFSIASNPGPIWSYLDGAGNALTQSASCCGTKKKVVNIWGNGNGYPTHSTIQQNKTGNPNISPPYNWPASELLMDGQSVGSVVRFTVPNAGGFKISGSFTGINTSCTGAHPVAVAVNGTYIWSATITTYGVPANFHLNTTLAAGDVVDFGSLYSGNANCLGTGLKATLTGP